jgi:radical SAM superfamily enzyme YgiQ (UPF0313 family)
MQLGEATLKLQLGESKQKRKGKLKGTHVRFSAHRCFRFDGGADDLACLAVLEAACQGHDRIAAAVDDAGRFLAYALTHRPGLAGRIGCVVQPRAFGEAAARRAICGIPVVDVGSLGVGGLGVDSAGVDAGAAGASAVLLADTRMFQRMQMRRLLPPSLTAIDLDVIGECPDQVPARAWVPWSRDVIYPMAVPEIDIERGLDLLLVDCPARNLGLMPNGVGYVHNALKHAGVRFQTLDLDIIIYHRFHVRRLFDEGGTITLPNGRVLPTDPWQAEHYDFWTEPDTLAFMRHEIDEVIARIIDAQPRVLALSIQACNEAFSAQVVDGVRSALPGLLVVVGGFSCYNADIGLRAFPQADYMCIGEADLTVGDLAARLAAGDRPRNLPGVISRDDDPAVPFIPAPMPHDLDLLEHPRYEWYPLDTYRNYNGYQLTPVIASRGCRWSRCTFCAERFYWRIRSAPAFVDELEWLTDQGCHLYMFNESDLNGMPEKVLDICDEIIRRGLHVKLTGQLRIHKKSDRAFFDKLRQAGFVALRFGVDAFSEHTLRLQKKGYTKATVTQNLRDCWEAGIYTEVNWVIGVPGETDEDVTEGIAFVLENTQYIGRLANINPLILVNGGVYWLEPDKHHIVFREPREELYATFARAIPAHLWYSTDPYIDELIRKERFERIIVALHDGGFDIGPWAARIIDDVKRARDIARVGGRAAATVEPAETAAIVTPVAAEAAAPAVVETTAEVPLVPSTPAPAAETAGASHAPARRLSDGVGPMADPDPGNALEFNPDARSGAYAFRAGSALPDDTIASIEPRVALVRHRGELFALDTVLLTETLGDDAIEAGQCGTSVVTSARLRVLAVETKGGAPQLMRAVGAYNVIYFDGTYYGVPQGLGEVKWGKTDLTGLPDVFIARRLADVVGDVERAQGIPPRPARRAEAGGASAPTAVPVIQISTRAASAAQPRLVGAMDGYNIIEFEGWYYGMPQDLGPLDLASTDVIEMPGVIRDLSREVVEGEIREVRVRVAAG